MGFRGCRGTLGLQGDLEELQVDLEGLQEDLGAAMGPQGASRGPLGAARDLEKKCGKRHVPSLTWGSHYP